MRRSTEYLPNRPAAANEGCGSEADSWGPIRAGWQNQPRGMPTISGFYGILIRMFFNDHGPPHFHARYGEIEATIDIGALAIIEGQLPRRAWNLVQEGARIHRGQLLEDWRLCRGNTPPTRIEPLA